MSNALGFFGVSVTSWCCPPTAPPASRTNVAERRPDGQLAVSIGFLDELISERNGDGSSQ